MKWHEKIVVVTGGAITVLTIASLYLYLILPPKWTNPLLFFWVITSSYTSLAGVFWSLYGVSKYHTQVESPLEQMQEKSSTLVGDLNEGFLEEFVDTLIQAEQRFANLPAKKQKRLVRMVDNVTDTLLKRVEKMPENSPKNRINKAKAKPKEDNNA